MKTTQIKWAPKARKEEIRKLYQAESRGLLSDSMVDNVGIVLLLRCESIIRVTNRRVECPECGTDFQLRKTWSDRETSFACPTPTCRWTVEWAEYTQSWRHRDLIGTAALTAYTQYANSFPQAKTAREKMILIDQLIHEFHRDSKSRLPHKSASYNLIEGNLKQIVEFLDSIFFADGIDKAKWRNDNDAATRRRRRKE